uniref:winged helix-turn-helix domain-containing protein n=1 Tax=Streptomyces sp. SA3_actF TaxID=682181 RepID=UPI002D219311
ASHPAAIAAALRDRIARGVLKAGDRIPTQAELSQEFGVERGRVRQALQALRAEGLLSHSTKGVPPRVAQPGHDGERAGGGTPNRAPRSSRSAPASYGRSPRPRCGSTPSASPPNPSSPP